MLATIRKTFQFIGIPLFIVGCSSTPGDMRAFSPTSLSLEDPSQGGRVNHNIRGAILTEQCINKAKKDGAIANVCEESVLFENPSQPDPKAHLITLDDAFSLCQDNDESCKADRNKLIDLAVKIADNNCNEFRERLFAERVTGGIFSGVARDTSNVGGAATAVGSPTTSIGFSITGLLVGAYEKTSHDLFSDKSAQIFDQAIGQGMSRFYAEQITPKCKDKSYGDCTIYRATNLAKQYASMCSIRAALLTIEQTLQVDTTVSEQATQQATQVAKEVAKSELNSAASQAVNDQVKTMLSKSQQDVSIAQQSARSAQDTAETARQKISALCKALKSTSSAVAASVGGACD